ncbi:hypothetical protein LIS04_91 [Listeria phage LIS04]|nr:hypothetical protein LIS04_91 [Listeria phage LIS04]
MMNTYLIAILVAVVIVAICTLVIAKFSSSVKSKIIEVSNALSNSDQLLTAIGVSPSTISVIKSVATEVIYAVEQSTVSGSEAKKEVALRELKLALSNLAKLDKFKQYELDKIDERVLSTIIESTVFVMNNTINKK